MPSVEDILKDLLSLIDIPYKSIERKEIAGQEIFSIEAGDEARALIGMRGDVVHALDTLVKKIYEKRLSPAPTSVEDSGGGSERDQRALFLIDVNDYRTKQIKDLQAKSLMMAERARSLQYDVELSPMSSYERLIVHTTLANEPHVKTESQGEGRNRRVVIKYTAV